MFTEERRNMIYEWIKEEKRISIDQLTEKFQVSGTTIRTDLTELEKAGKIIRTHGGAMINEDPLYREDSISARRDLHIHQKKKIAREARKLINDGDTILLDSGTTSLELAKLLHDTMDITVITNDLQIALELQKMQNIYLIMLGGRVRNHFECTVGSSALRFLEELSVDKAFVTSNAVSISRGITTPSIENAEIKSAMMNIAEKRYLICDSSKIGRRTTCRFGKLENLDLILTDEGATEGFVESVKGKGTKVLICR